MKNNSHGVTKQHILEALEANRLKIGTRNFEEGYFVDINDTQRVVVKYNSRDPRKAAAAMRTARDVLEDWGFRVGLSTSTFVSIPKARR